MTYTLLFPFRFSASREMNLETVSDGFEFNGLRYELGENNTYYRLKISGFQTPEEAEAFCDTVWTALLWVTLHKTTAVLGTTTPQPMRYGDLKDPLDPSGEGRVDSIVDASRPAVVREGATLRTVAGGAAGLLVTTPADQIEPLIREGLAHARRGVEDESVRLALSLFNEHWEEASAQSKLVSLVVCLEVLSSPKMKHDVAQSLLDRWEVEIQVALESLSDPEEQFALEALRRELTFRREDSLRSRVRELVRASLAQLSPAEREATAKRAVEVYDLRSTLIHEGTVSADLLGRAVEDAREIASALLKERIAAPDPQGGLRTGGDP